MLKSLRSPAFEEQIKQIKDGRNGFCDVPAGWPYKWVKSNTYDVFYLGELMGHVSKLDNIPGYIERIIKARAKNVRIRKITSNEYALYVEGKLIFMGNSPKHCWVWLAERNAPT